MDGRQNCTGSLHSQTTHSYEHRGLRMLLNSKSFMKVPARFLTSLEQEGFISICKVSAPRQKSFRLDGTYLKRIFIHILRCWKNCTPLKSKNQSLLVQDFMHRLKSQNYPDSATNSTSQSTAPVLGERWGGVLLFCNIGICK